MQKAVKGFSLVQPGKQGADVDREPANAIVLFLACCLLLAGCVDHRFEREFFFKNPAATRINRLRQYSLEDQYRLFRYGNDRFEPPLTGLARTIAEKGRTAIPFLLGKLNPQADDMTVRDTLLLFETMGSINSYDVKTDAVVMETLRSRVSAMKDANWKTVCSKMLRRIEAN